MRLQDTDGQVVPTRKVNFYSTNIDYDKNSFSLCIIMITVDILHSLDIPEVQKVGMHASSPLDPSLHPHPHFFLTNNNLLVVWM